MPDERFDFRRIRDWADSRYVLAGSEEHKRLLSIIPKVESLENKFEELKQSSWRNERYMVGGVDENNKYTLGLMPKVSFVQWGLGLALLLLIFVVEQIITGKVVVH